MNQWYEEGIITDEALSISNPGMYENYIKANQTGFVVSSNSTMALEYKEFTGDEDFELYPLAEPTRVANVQLEMGPVENSVTVDNGWAISTACEYPEAAVSYINWFFTDEGDTYCNLGELGTTYVLDDDGNPQYTELVTNSEFGVNTSTAAQLYSGYTGGTPFIYRAIHCEMTMTSEAEAISSSVWSSNTGTGHVYYGTLTADEGAIYSQRIGDISTFVSEKIAQYILGEISFDTFESEFYPQLEDMGIAELTELKQAAYNRYLSR